MTKLNKAKKTRRPKKWCRVSTYVLFIMSIVTLGIVFFLNVLPIGYFLVLLGFILVYDGLMAYLLLGRGWKKRLFGTIFTLLAILLMAILFVYSFHTLDFLHKITGQDYNTENYSVIVKKESSYEKLKDIKGEKVGYITNEEDPGMEEAKKYLSKKVDVEYASYDDMSELFNDFINEKIDVLLIEDAEKSILEEKHDDFVAQEKIIYTFSIDVKMEDNLAKEVNISKNPFNIYISGIDTYGKITSVSRSDVNMVVTVNPKTNQILFTSIPRDYYVKLHGVNTTYKDKLTHAGIHGIDMSVKTVEDLLNTEINYYAKVNFTSLVSIVDELGGIDVETDTAFRAYYIEDKVIDYSFKKGTNHLNGKQALAYCRERKSLATGDIARTKHQQQVLEAIINKALSKTIITKYSDILNALEGKFVTNIGTKNITTFIKNQMKSMPSWTIEKNTLTGTGELNYTYSYKSAKSYVMVPDEESLQGAITKIHSLLENE